MRFWRGDYNDGFTSRRKNLRGDFQKIFEQKLFSNF